MFCHLAQPNSRCAFPFSFGPLWHQNPQRRGRTLNHGPTAARVRARARVIAVAMATLEDLKIPEIKKILRGCDIDATDILAAKTRFELIELAHYNGIYDVPDEWTIAKIKQQRLEARAQASATANSIGGGEANEPSGNGKGKGGGGGLLGKGASMSCSLALALLPLSVPSRPLFLSF